MNKIRNFKFMIGLCLMLTLSQPWGMAQADGYFHNMKRNLIRGSKNIISSPAELVTTVGEYRKESTHHPVLQWSGGIANGFVQMTQRAWSGIWDFVVAAIPSQQEGMPVKPETLF